MVKMFFAGAEAFGKEVGECGARGLINFFYVKDKTNILTYKADHNLKELFLDSGAFTAWTKTVKISIKEYCEFVKKSDCDFYSVLDVIGDDKATFENQKKMEELGTHPIPCFHFGDDWKYLDYYCKNHDFVSIGGMVGKASKVLRPWLDNIFHKYPNHKFHGFGLTRVKLIERYPWYSVDSSSWIQSNASKNIFSYKLGQLYLGNSSSVTDLILKNNTPWRKFFELHGLPITNVLNDYKTSLKANIYGYKEFEDITESADITKQKTLF